LGTGKQTRTATNQRHTEDSQLPCETVGCQGHNPGELRAPGIDQNAKNRPAVRPANAQRFDFMGEVQGGWQIRVRQYRLMCCGTQRCGGSNRFHIAALHAFLEQGERLAVLGYQLLESRAMVLLVIHNRIDFSTGIEDDHGQGRGWPEGNKELAMQMVPQCQARKQ
jgi:hypothetical protein